MKIGPKLAICFAVLAVVPVAVSSYVNSRSTVDLGQQMAEGAQGVFAERLTDEITRTSKLGAEQIDTVLREILDETKRNAEEIGGRLNSDADPKLVERVAKQDFAAEAANDQANGPRLDRGNVRLEEDADRNAVAVSLARLWSLISVGRTTFLRNQNVVSGLTLIMEQGYTIWYPGGTSIEPEDLRERSWYLDTLEQNNSAWTVDHAEEYDRFFALSPIIEPNGSLAGVMRLTMPVGLLMTATVPEAAMTKGADGFLILIPEGHPNLFPHVIAEYHSGSTVWSVHKSPEPLSINGNDRWLKVISDMRSGVGGMISVKRNNNEEVWAFSPLQTNVGGQLILATVLPGSVVDKVRAEAQSIVGTAFRSQIEQAAIFAVMAALVGVALALFGAKTLTAPIRRLYDASQKLAAGDFTVRIKDTGSDELAQLSRGFNEIAPALEHRMRVQQDLFVAQEIQQHLISRTPPSIDGFDIVGKTIYCDETGGDYQDFIPLGENGRFAAVIGDITGHGVGAALLMATARASLRAHASHNNDPTDLICSVNADLSADSSGGRFLTLFFLQVHSRGEELAWISAGHEPALIFDPKMDAFVELSGEDIPLGVDATWSYSASTVTLKNGSILIGYTDGVREAISNEGKPFGLDRIKSAVRKSHMLGSTAITNQILDDVKAFQGEQKQRDDISVLVVRSV